METFRRFFSQPDDSRKLTGNEVRIYHVTMKNLSYLSDISENKLSDPIFRESMLFSLKCNMEQIKNISNTEVPKFPEEPTPLYSNIHGTTNTPMSLEQWLSHYGDYILECINYMTLEFCSKVSN